MAGNGIKINAAVNKYPRFADENPEQYIYRITGLKDKIGTWKDVASIINVNLGTNYSESTFRKRRQMYDMMWKYNVFKMDETVKKLVSHSLTTIGGDTTD